MPSTLKHEIEHEMGLSLDVIANFDEVGSKMRRFVFYCFVHFVLFLMAP